MTRIAVYSPARNEEANVRPWFACAAGADEVVLVDTGSTDDTFHIAAEIAEVAPNMKVRRAIVSPWRFDDGFNAALSQVSATIDIAVPLHLDERLEFGWRGQLEEAWEAGGRQFTFNYQWDDNLTYRHDRIHARHGYRWKYPAHECPVGLGPRVDTDVFIAQFRDPNKDRSKDEALIHLMLDENPTDSRAQYYSAREYYYRNNWTLSRRWFSVYLANKASQYDQERSEACRMMARMVWPEEKEKWLLRAVSEAPQRREVWADLAMHYYDNGLDDQARGVAHRVLSITERNSENSFHLEKWAWLDEKFRQMTAVVLA